MSSLALREVFQGFDGKLHRVEVPQRIVRRRHCDAAARPLLELCVSEVDRLSADELAVYERRLGLSALRKREDRLRRLGELVQTNRLESTFASSHGQEAGASSVAGPSAVQARGFGDLTDYEKSQLSARELRFLAKQAHISDLDGLSVEERGALLKDMLRRAQAQAGGANASSLSHIFGKMAAKSRALREIAEHSRVHPIEVDD